jgi:hypothetical protein
MKLQPGFDQLTRILVVSDNDRDPKCSFAEVRLKIHNGGFVCPNQDLACATGSPSVAVMMIPIGEPGQLETLCLRAVKDAWPTQYNCAETYGECAGILGWKIAKQERARLRALISHICEEDPNSSLTYMWHDGREEVIPLSHACFDQIADFLKDFDALVAGAA